ncbi:hypothetical protein QZH41_000752 [Actinostola sp. cb2023]|nr:hypothetical protein QZH41_000752 [Actinostola sp. cb2023]
MCFEEKTIDTKEGFLTLAIEKRVRNKRRRDPDMYVDVLLSSTVKRLKYELVNEDFGHKRGIKRKISHIPKKTDTVSSRKSTQKELADSNEVIKAVECLQSTLEALDDEIRNEPTATKTIPPNLKENMNNEHLCTTVVAADPGMISESGCESLGVSKEEVDVDFDTLMQSLLEICEPLSGNVDELLKEYSIDPSSSGTFDVMSSNDPFLPGMFEVMCS